MGMAMDVIHRDGGCWRAVVPGATLFHGVFSALMKGVTLLWALFLVAGPRLEDVAYILDKVTGTTTDMGG